MFKKIVLTIIGLALSSLSVFAQDLPEIECDGLPACNSISEDTVPNAIISIAGYIIQYIAAFAVIAVMISGIMYLISSGDEEKVKKAKTWIIWSLAGVFISVSAWLIINLINNFNI